MKNKQQKATAIRFSSQSWESFRWSTHEGCTSEPVFHSIIFQSFKEYFHWWQRKNYRLKMRCQCKRCRWKSPFHRMSSYAMDTYHQNERKSRLDHPLESNCFTRYFVEEINTLVRTTCRYLLDSELFFFHYENNEQQMTRSVHVDHSKKKKKITKKNKYAWTV